MITNYTLFHPVHLCEYPECPRMSLPHHLFWFKKGLHKKRKETAICFTKQWYSSHSNFWRRKIQICFWRRKNTLLRKTQFSHFHLVRRWIHVNDRCKNFISFYNRSRIKLSAPRKDNMSQHFHIGNSFSFISEFSANEKWLWTKITSFGEHFSKDFPFSTQKRLSCPSKCRNYFICIRSS